MADLLKASQIIAQTEAVLVGSQSVSQLIAQTEAVLVGSQKASQILAQVEWEEYIPPLVPDEIISVSIVDSTTITSENSSYQSFLIF